MRLASAVLASLALALVVPTAAGAATFDVNDLSDTSDVAVGDAACDSNDVEAGPQCTLRAAIQEANQADSTAAEPHLILIGLAGKISITSPLDVTESAIIDSAPGSGCDNFRTEPCTHLEGLDRAHDGLTFGAGADGSGVDGFAFTGFDRAVVTDSNLGLVRNWFGLDRDKIVGPNNIGVLMRGNGGQIGGSTQPTAGSTSRRNVFAGNRVLGVKLEGDSNKVLGNYFGTLPDGTTAAPQGENIEVTGASGSEHPTGNQIGDASTGDAADSAACDGNCNVIAAADGLSAESDPDGNGIDLIGTTSAGDADDVTIRANHIGVDAPGTGALGNGSWGVFAKFASAPTDPFAPQLTVGGPDAADGNLISDNGTGGVNSTVETTLQQNRFGAGATGGQLGDQEEAAEIGFDDATFDFLVDGNLMLGSGASDEELGLKLLGNVDVTGNRIGETAGGSPHGFATDAILTWGNLNQIGKPGQGNTIASSGANGVSLDSLGTKVQGNTIKLNSLNGVFSQTGPRLGLVNTIGGDGAGEANTFTNNGADAIRVQPGSGAEILANLGQSPLSANGLFIDLGPDGPGNADPGSSSGGLQAPAITSARTDRVTGIGLPGTTVRLFRKATSQPGELGQRVGNATVAAGGTWTVTSTLPVGQRVVATLSVLREGDPGEADVHETSELSGIAVTSAPPIIGGGGPVPGPGSTPTPLSPAPTLGDGVIRGTAGNDEINGTAGDDVIECGGGDDVVRGGGGNDVIRCGAGNDVVDGGAGNDRVLGESGNDRVGGGSGRDRVGGGSGRDRVGGGSGNDRAAGDSGNDRVGGGSGNDRLSGGSGNDRLSGDRGNDRIAGDRGNDRLSGGRGNDRLSGGRGRDRLNGGPGRDRQRQ